MSSSISKLIHLSQYEWQKMTPGLERMKWALKKLKHPEKKIKFIHLAGSNGKGSTAAILESIILQAGFKVALFSSPHLIHIQERFRINQKNILKSKLERVLIDLQELFPDLLSENKAPLSFFEICALIAFYYFEKEKVDYALIETGLGGRLDATNVIQPMASIITQITLEHQDILGSTLKKIAQEKAGIIKNKKHVFVIHQSSEVLNTIQKVASQKHAPLFIVHTPPLIKSISIHNLQYPLFDYLHFKNLRTNFLGLYIVENIQLALNCIFEGPHRNIFLKKLSFQKIQKALLNIKWPGRLELLQLEAPIILDGSHNLQGIESSLKSLVFTFKKIKKLTIILGASKLSNLKEILFFLIFSSASYFENPIKIDIHWVSFKHPRAIKATKENLEKILSSFKKKSNQKIKVWANVESCYPFLKKKMKKNELLWICGSLFLHQEIKKINEAEKKYESKNEK